jgi:hypothetical protein
MMGRRGNGEGTITRRKDGRWEARYYVPTMNGTKRKMIYGRTRAEVSDKLTKALSDRVDGIVHDDENMTVGEYLDVWLKGSVYGSVRRSTYDRDTNLVNNHIKPILGGLKLKKINSAHVQSFYRDRLEVGLSASTVHKMHDILRRGLAQATKWHLVPRSGKVVFGEPKTKKSRRSIRLTAQAVEALRSHLQRQLRDMEILGDRYHDQGLVFTTDTGAPINPSNLRQRSFAALLKRAGLPHMRFHDLRHTCATLLLSRGVHPKFVQELLGHATIAITLDTYSHVMPSMGDATARAMEDALA